MGNGSGGEGRNTESGNNGGEREIAAKTIESKAATAAAVDSAKPGNAALREAALLTPQEIVALGKRNHHARCSRT